MHIGIDRGRRLVEDIVAARHGMMELAGQHNLRPEDLAAWINEPANQRVLSGLCVLADLQTQVLLSRYRLHAATRLIKLATDEKKEPGQPEIDLDLARRACVDLLKLELKRADVAGGEAEEGGEDLAAFRRSVLGAEEDAHI